MGLALHPAITILIALVPALEVWWRNHRLIRLIDDPAFPERLFADRLRRRTVLGVSLGLLIFTGIGRLSWAIPVLLVARIAAAYPFRKRVFEESWGFFTYLWFYLRLCLALFGWIVVAFLPAVLGLTSTYQWASAVVFGLAAAVWTTWFSTAFRRILGATPVASPGILSRFERLRDRCGLPPISLEQVAMRGGVLANAVALPSLTGRAVVMTDTLAERFDEDELTAILAHELAHHEHYDRRRLIKRQIGSYILIMSGVIVPPVFQAVAPEAMMLAVVVWVGAVFVGLGLQMQHRQKHETESDLRAVELTGNPEALARALTKLNAFARLPRRWSEETERQSTHPSLARRLQAIRDSSKTQTDPILEATPFADVQNETTITFRADVVEWREGSTAHEFAYGSLAELRIDLNKVAAPQLLVVDAKGRRWEFALQPADVARAQATLDIVDVRLGRSQAPAVAPLLAVHPVRILVWVSITLASSIGQIAVLIPALLAAYRPASQLLAASGAGVVAASLVGWRDDPLRSYGLSQVWLDGVLFICGVALLVAAQMRRKIDDAAPGKLLALIVVCAASAWMMIALSGTTSLDLYRSVREWPSVSVLTLACGGSFAFARSKRLRQAAAPTLVVGFVSLFVGTSVFANRFVNDPFVVEAAEIVVKNLGAEPPLRVHPMRFDPSLLWISPRGGYVAISSEDDDENITIHAGPAGSELTSFSADEAASVDEHHLLLLERETRGSVLHLVDLADADRELWTVREPLRTSSVSVDRASRQWRLVGLDQAGRIASAEGHLGDSIVARTAWESPAGDGYIRPIAAARGAVLALESRSVFSPMENIFVRTPFLPSHFRLETRLWNLAGRDAALVATSRADVECVGSATMNEPAVCGGFDGTSTRFFSIAAGLGQLEPLTSMDGRFHVRGQIENGWLAGWMNSVPVLLHGATAEVLRMPDASTDRVYQLAMGDTVFAALAWGSETSTLRIYPRSDSQ